MPLYFLLSFSDGNIIQYLQSPPPQRRSQVLKKGGVYCYKVSGVISEDERFIIFAMNILA